MKRKIIRSVFALLFLGAGSTTFASSDNTSKQIQQLNSQIQAQLQQIQEAQKKYDQTSNKQIQDQLKQVQSNIEKEIMDSYNKTQAQIKTMQDALQLQIQQVNKNAMRSSKNLKVAK